MNLRPYITSLALLAISILGACGESAKELEAKRQKESAQKTAEQLRVYQEVATEVASLYETLDQPGSATALDAVLAKAPTHPLALTYRAYQVASDKKYDEAIALLRKARAQPELTVATCRAKDDVESYKRYLASKCKGSIFHGWADVNAYWLCPPDAPGTEAWQAAVDTVEYNLVSLVLTKLFDDAGGKVENNGICP